MLLLLAINATLYFHIENILNHKIPLEECSLYQIFHIENHILVPNRSYHYTVQSIDFDQSICSLARSHNYQIVGDTLLMLCNEWHLIKSKEGNRSHYSQFPEKKILIISCNGEYSFETKYDQYEGSWQKIKNQIFFHREYKSYRAYNIINLTKDTLTMSTLGRHGYVYYKYVTKP